MLSDRRRVLELTTGAGRTTTMTYLPDGDGMIVVAGAGDPAAWLDELRDEPMTNVKAGAFTFPARAEIAGGERAAALLARIAEVEPELARDAQAVVVLTPEGGGPPPGRPGDMLIAVHEGLRQELALIREEVAAARGAATLVLQLRINCLTFCQTLHYHHMAEDTGLFAWLRGQRPDLAEPLARLADEHAVVAELLEEMNLLLGDAGDDGARADPAKVLAEVDRLTTRLLAHLDYEEEQLVPVLNGL
ncbi:hemerythrin domain-containing protein [Nonomuraea sp. NBC_01738]|uniref:nitroreductase/quinone reductase family protein n=1 Tax=Nonomuraea sp. NBC_01738 TaxID=2976003 RepID=UPI002E130BAA|nr:hemerythrin domain-containing protein [Nonomuraea sp. NBC_01738]